MHDGRTLRIRTVETTILIALGGFAGANLRYVVGDQVAGVGATLLVNVVGSFLLGVLLYEAHYTGVLSGHTRLAVGTGFLASFTTYSTFALESYGLGTPAGLGYVATSYLLAFGAVLAGRRVASELERGRFP
ncbi:MAG: CrcB family protein [Halanaeroarchaeum sp.]